MQFLCFWNKSIKSFGWIEIVYIYIHHRMNCNNSHWHFYMNYYIILRNLTQIFVSSLSPPPELQAQIHQDVNSEADFSRQTQSSSRYPALAHQQLALEPRQNLGLSKQLNGALQRALSTRGSRNSVCAEDLLTRTEEKQMTPRHFRSHSSPTRDRQNQVR